MVSWYTAQPFVPVKYIPACQRDKIRAKPVFYIHVAAHKQQVGPYAGGFTNHWSLYLQTGTQDSVRIDVQPNLQYTATTILGGHKADIVVSPQTSIVSENAIHFATMAVPPGLAVAHIVDYIIQSGRDKYEFTAEGVGCRRWILDTLTLLGQRGWLNPTAVEAAKDDVGKLWPNQTPLALGGGGYYSA